MNEKLKNHLDTIFGHYTELKQVKEIKEELFLDLSEKMEELKLKGIEEELAFNTTIESIGDINELIEDITSKTRELQIKIGIDCSMSNLIKSDLRNIIAIKGKFDYSNLVESDFSNSNLSSSSFKCSNLEKCLFDNTNLTNAKFDKSNLKGSSFKNAILDNTKFVFCDLSGISFENLSIIGANFNYAGLKKTSFRNATLINVSFKTELKKTETDFSGAKMDKVTYAMLKGYKANLENVTIIEN